VFPWTEIRDEKTSDCERIFPIHKHDEKRDIPTEIQDIKNNVEMLPEK